MMFARKGISKYRKLATKTAKTAYLTPAASAPATIPVIITFALLQVIIRHPLQFFRGPLRQFPYAIAEIDLEVQQLQLSGAPLCNQWRVYLKIEEAS